VKGTERNRAPVASKTAFAIAAGIAQAIGPPPRNRPRMIDERDLDLRRRREAHGLLRRLNGATIATIMESTGWQVALGSGVSDELPKTGTGKIDRQALLRPSTSGG
jgi:hypothetical protein